LNTAGLSIAQDVKKILAGFQIKIKGETKMTAFRIFKALNCRDCFFNGGKPKSPFPEDLFCGFRGKLEIDHKEGLCLSKEKHSGDREYLRG